MVDQLLRPRRLLGSPDSVFGAFAGGLTGGLAFVTVDLAVRVVAHVPTVGELLQDRLIQATPGPVFAFILDRLHYLGKPAFFVGFLLFVAVLWGAAGIVVARTGRLVQVAVVGWLVVGAMLLAAGHGPFAERADVVITTAAATLAFAVTLELLWRTRRAQEHAPATGGTRLFARRELLVGVALLGASAVLAKRAIGTLPKLSIQAVGLPEPVTPANEFYLVSKNLADPEVNGVSWRLRLDGLVDRPVDLTYEQIKSMPSEEFVRTLECISNEIGGDLISTGRFTGVRLGEVLRQVGLQPSATVLHFTSADGYTENMPVAKALDDTTFLVYLLNGEPLPTKHGYPLRVLAAGVYGMKNPKWLTRIEAAVSAPEGFWEEQGWAEAAPVQTMSRIDVPKVITSPAGALEFAGIAFAGDRGIRGVQVSLDAGPWVDTELEPALGPLTWAFWHHTLDVSPGQHHIAARAVDGTGAVQTDRLTDTFPDGATGQHQINIEASPPRS